MERRDRSINITVRIPEGLLRIIESEVNSSGEYASRADFILAAIRHYIEFRKKE